jgi:tripartite-type tricarboxylate transporter receptor subunit TctC
VAETIPGFESSQWWGLFAPAGLPPDVVSRLNGEVDKTVRDQEMRNRFAAEGAEPAGGSPAEFAAFFKADHDKWGKVVSDVGIRPE